MNINTQTKTIPARELHAGDRLLNKGANVALPVTRIMPCADGSIRVFTAGSEARMTGSVLVRISAVH